MSVLAIILTAPLGALATSLLGPVLLKKLTDEKKEEEEGEEPENYISVTDMKTGMSCAAVLVIRGGCVQGLVFQTTGSKTYLTT